MQDLLLALMVILFIIICLIGIKFFINVRKYFEDNRKKRDELEQLNILKKLLPSIKLKDNGTDIDENIKILEKNDIKISHNKDD